MGEPVVLPKFQLHGDKPHWAVRAAWISGGVLLLSIAGLVAVIMHRHTLEVEAHVAKQEALARVKAEAESRVAAAAAAAKAAKEAELAEKRAALAAAEAAKAAQNAPAGAADDTAAKGTKTSHRSHSGHGGKASKLAAKTGGGVKTDSSTKSSGSGKPKSDPIDDLLKKMK
jgi:membrane protein involved in colicin uptake